MEQYFTCHIARTTLVSGAGATNELVEVVRKLGGKKPMIVTTGDLPEQEWFQQLTKSLEEVVVFDKVTPNPKDFEVMEGAELYKENACDVVIGVGGGSSMDASKSISAIVRNEGFIMDYGRSTPNRKYFVNGREPLVVVPTTIGTGSEISPHAVITNTAKNRKSDLQETIFYPDYIIMDVNLLMTLPKKIVRDTGIDALCHCIETYTSRHAIYNYAPLHETAALKGIELVAGNLRRAVFAGDVDLKAKSMIQWAAFLGGFALDLDAGCCHGLAGMLQKYHHEISHGESVGMMLPAVMEYNLKAAPERFKNIAIAFGENVEGLTDIEAAEKAVAAVRKLLKDIDFAKVSDYVKDASEIDEFYEEGAKNSENKNNIRSVTPDEIKSIYLAAYQDRYEA